jgi:hypothetical protein
LCSSFKILFRMWSHFDCWFFIYHYSFSTPLLKLLWSLYP